MIPHKSKSGYMPASDILGSGTRTAHVCGDPADERGDIPGVLPITIRRLEGLSLG